MQEYKWLDKPSGDGLWWNYRGGKSSLLLVRKKKYCFVLDQKLQPDPWSAGLYNLDEVISGKWLFQPITAPKSPEPTQPPEVKWFTGVHRVDGIEIMVGKVGDNYLLYRN